MDPKSKTEEPKIIEIEGYIGQSSGLAALFGDGSETSLKSVRNRVEELGLKKGDDVTLLINSGGGSVNEGFAIHDYITTQGFNVSTEVLGLCGSIATICGLTAPPERRKMHKNSEYYIHNPYWTPTGPDPLEATDLQKLADELKGAQERILNFYADKTGKTVDDLSAFMEEARSFTAEEAKEYGFIGEVIEAPAEAARKYEVLAYIDPKKIKKSNEMDPIKKDSTRTWLKEQFNKIEAAISKVAEDTKAPEIKNGEELGAVINGAIDGAVTEDTTRDDILAQLAEAASIEVDEVNNILSGSTNCPDAAVLESFAGVLNADSVSFFEAGTADGCEYNVEAAKIKRLEAQKADLEAQLKTAKDEKAALKTAQEEQKASLDTLAEEVAALKKVAIGDDEPPKKKSVDPKIKAPVSATPGLQGLASGIANMAKKKGFLN